uniref:Uncharacterized protein n=1 Tax=Arundo donax TaxID=35708 RepID=A0A0A9DT40_ARUDO
MPAVENKSATIACLAEFLPSLYANSSCKTSSVETWPSFSIQNIIPNVEASSGMLAANICCTNFAQSLRLPLAT